MTPQMEFECLLVSQDPALYGTINKVLCNFSISVEHCLSSSKASDIVTKGTHDLVVIERNAGAQFLEDVRRDGSPVLIGDARREAWLEEANVKHARSIIIATTDVRALARYYAADTVARFPLLTLDGAPAGSDPTGGLAADRIDGAASAQLALRSAAPASCELRL